MHHLPLLTLTYIVSLYLLSHSLQIPSFLILPPPLPPFPNFLVKCGPAAFVLKVSIILHFILFYTSFLVPRRSSGPHYLASAVFILPGYQKQSVCFHSTKYPHRHFIIAFSLAQYITCFPSSYIFPSFILLSSLTSLNTPTSSTIPSLIHLHISSCWPQNNRLSSFTVFTGFWKTGVHRKRWYCGLGWSLRFALLAGSLVPMPSLFLELQTQSDFNPGVHSRNKSFGFAVSRSTALNRYLLKFMCMFHTLYLRFK